MPVILVAGTEPGAGATTVAAGLAYRLAYAGHSVRLERLRGDQRAEQDAQTFADLEYADATGLAIEPGDVRASDGVTVVEAPAGSDAAALARTLDATLLQVAAEGGQAAEGAHTVITRARRAAPWLLPEDRTLAAPTVGAIVDACRARVLASSDEGDDAVCEHLLIGAISHDPDEPYFRRFSRPAVITRAEKVDIVLAAMRTSPVLVLLTGGGEPSPYILDRVGASRDTTLALTDDGTVETVRDIEGLFGATPFRGEPKVERVGELMRQALDDEALKALLGS